MAAPTATPKPSAPPLSFTATAAAAAPLPLAVDILSRRSPVPPSAAETTPPVVSFSESERRKLASPIMSFASSFPTSLPPSFLFLLLGDAHILNTSFEGGNIGNNAALLSQLISHVERMELFRSESESLRQIQQGLASICEWEWKIRGVCDKSEEVLAEKPRTLRNLKALADELTRAVLSLKPGETITLPGGYSKKPFGHDMIYEIKKVDSEHVDITFHNSGSGLEMHPETIHGLKRKQFTSLKLSRVPLSEILGTSSAMHTNYFLTLLLFLTNPYEIKFTSKDVYTALIFPFQDKASFTSTAHPLDVVLTPQRSGTCSMKSLFAFFRHKTSPTAYKGLAFFIKATALIKFFISSQESLSQDSPEADQLRYLIKEGAKKLSLRIGKSLLGRPFLSLDEQKHFLAAMEEILTDIHAKEEVIASSRKSRAHRFELRLPSAAPSLELVWTSKVPAKRGALLTVSASPFYEIPPALETYSPALLASLQRASKLIESYKAEFELNHARSQIVEFIKRIPHPLNQTFYDSIPREEIPALLNELSKMFIEFENLAIAHRFSIVNHRVTLFTIYAIVTQLCMQYEKTLPPELRLSPYFGIDLKAQPFSFEHQVFLLTEDFHAWRSLEDYFSRFPKMPLEHPHMERIKPEDRFSTTAPRTLLQVLSPLAERFHSSLTPYYSSDAHHPAIRERKSDFLPYHYNLLELLVDNCLPSFNPAAAKTGFDLIGCSHLQTLKLFLISLHRSLTPIDPKYEFTCLHRGIVSAIEKRISLYDITFEPDRSSIITLKDRTLEPSKQTPGDFLKCPLISYSPLLFSLPLIAKTSRSRIPPTSETALVREARDILDLHEGADASALTLGIEHALSYDTLRPVELLTAAAHHANLFKDQDVRLYFLQQLFKSTLTERSNPVLEGSLDDRAFQEAALHFLGKGKDFLLSSDSEKFQIFIFIMQVGVFLLAQYPPGHPFAIQIKEELQFIDQEIAASKCNADAKRVLHGLRALRESILLEHAGRVGVAPGTDLIRPAFNFFASAAYISDREMDFPEHDYLYRMIEDKFSSLLALKLQPHFISKELLREVIKIRTSLDLDPRLEVTHRPDLGPYCFSFNDELNTKINLLTMTVWNQHDYLSNLPASLLSYDSDYVELFGVGAKHTISSSSPYFFFSDPSLGRFRVYRNESFFIQKQIGEEWGQYVSKNNLFRLIGCKMEDSGVISAPVPLFLVSDFHAWETPSAIYFTDPKDGSVAYVMPKETEISSDVTKVTSHSSRILRVDSTSGTLTQSAQIFPVSSLPPSWAALILRIEQPGFVYLERRASSFHLIFHRYKTSDGSPLSFIVGQDGLYLEADPEYKICETYSESVLGRFSSFLVLEHCKTHKHTALIPALPYASPANKRMIPFAKGSPLDVLDGNGGGTTYFRPCQGTRTYYEVALQGDDLEPLTADQQLLACYIAAGQKEYKKALSYLKALTFADLHTKKEVDFLVLILKLFDDDTQDYTPFSICLQLRCHYLLFRHHFLRGEAFPKPSRRGSIDLTDESSLVKHNRIKELYTIYLENLGNIPEDFKLDFAEERFIIEHSLKIKTSSLVVHRERLLDGTDPLHLPCSTQKGNGAVRKYTVSFLEEEPFRDLPIGYPSNEEIITRLQNADLFYFLSQFVSDFATTTPDPRGGAPLPSRSDPFHALYILAVHARKTPHLRSYFIQLFRMGILITEHSSTEKKLFAYALLLLKCSAFTENDPPDFRSWLLTPAGQAIEEASRSATSTWLRPNPLKKWKELVHNHFSYPTPEGSSPQTRTLVEQVDLNPYGSAIGSSYAPRPFFPHASLIRSPLPEGEPPMPLTFDPSSAHREFLAHVCHRLTTPSAEIPSIPFGYGARRVSMEEVRTLPLTIRRSVPKELASAVSEEARDFCSGYELITSRDDRFIPGLSLRASEELYAQISRAAVETQERLTRDLSEILAFVDTKPLDAVAATIHSAERASLTRKKLDLPDLLFLFLEQKKSAYKQALPHFTDDQIHRLNNAIGLWLYHSIENQQMTRLSAKLDELIKALRSSSLGSAAESIASDGTIAHPSIVSLSLELRSIARQKIDYDPFKSPQFLVFEHTSKLMFRDDPAQRKLIEAMTEKNHVVSQVIMGGGKTTVIAANLLAKACSEGQIAIFITPSFQYRSLYESMKKSLKTNFNIDAITFEFSREDLKKESLTAIFETLEEVRLSAREQSPKALVLCPETILLMVLEYQTIMKKIASHFEHGDAIPAELAQKGELLREILVLLKTHGYALGDEAHILLDIIKEIFIPVGAKKDVDPKNIDHVISLFYLLETVKIRFSAEEIAQISTEIPAPERRGLGLPERSEEEVPLHQLLRIAENKQAYFPTSFYHRYLIPKIAAAISSHPGLRLSSEEQTRFTRYVQGQMRGQVQIALAMGDVEAYHASTLGSQAANKLNDEDIRDLEFVFKLRRLHQSGIAEDTKAADLIALTKYLLSDLLPFAFKKTGNANFGRTREAAFAGKVVPYLCSDTPSENEFGNHYEAIVYHLMTSLIYGVEDHQIESLFKTYHEEALDISELRGIAYNDTPAAKECFSLFGIYPDQFKDHFATIKTDLKNPALTHDQKRLKQLLRIERHTIDQYVHYQDQKLNAHAHMLVDLFPRFHAFSGTPDTLTLSTKLQKNPLLDPTVNPRCIRAYLEKPSKVFILPISKAAQFVKDSFDRLSESERSRAYALLDAGGALKDFDNLEVAKALLAECKARGRTDIQGVIFFTRHNGSTTADYPALLRMGSSDIEILRDTSKKELEMRGLKEGDYFAFYDARHCTGTDIKMPAQAVGLLIYDPSVGIDDATQAMMRFRDYLMNQSLVTIVPDYAARAIGSVDPAISFSTLVESGDDTRAKQSIVSQMISAQVIQRSQKMIKSFKKMMTHTVYDYAITELQKHPLSAAQYPKIQQILAAFMQYLVQSSVDTPYDSYGSLLIDMDIVASLTRMQKNILENLESSLTKASFQVVEKQTILREISKRLSAIIADAGKIQARFSSSIREFVDEGSDAGALDGEMEMVAETEAQTQVETEAVVEVEREIQDELSRLQSPATLVPNPLPRVQAHVLLTMIFEQLSSPGAKDTLIPLGRMMAYPEHTMPYHKLFAESSLYLTPSYYAPYTEKISFFHRKMRPAEHLLVLEIEGEYKGVLVSEDEASILAEYIRHVLPAHTQKDIVWLVMPNGNLQAGSPKWNEIRDTLGDIMIEFALLSGNTEYLMKNLEDYVTWFDRSHSEAFDDEGAGAGAAPRVTYRSEEIKIRFLKLLAARHPTEKRNLVKYLADRTNLDRIVGDDRHIEGDTLFAGDPATIDLSKIRGARARHLPAAAVARMTSSHRRLIKYLNNAAQISALPPSLIPYITNEQVSLLAPHQIRFIASESQLQLVPSSVIGSLEVGHVPDSHLLSKLSNEQLKALRNPALIDQIPEPKIGYIAPEMTPHLGTKYKTTFLALLSDEHLLRASPAQWTEILEDPSLTGLTARYARMTLPALIGRVRGPFLRYLSIPHLSSVNPENVRSIPPAQLMEFIPQTHASLLLHASPEQRAALSPDYIRALRNTYVIASLSTEQLIHIDPSLVRSLPTEAIPKLPPVLIPHLVPTQLPHLTLDQLRTINDVRIIQNLSIEQVVQVPAFWPHLSDTQISRLEMAHLAVISYINPEQFFHLQTTVLQRLSAEQIARIPARSDQEPILRRLTAAQLTLLSYGQLQGIVLSQDIIQLLPYECYKTIPRFFRYLNPSQIAQFRPEDTGVFTHLPQNAWIHLSDEVIHSMSPQTIQSITYDNQPLFNRLLPEQMAHLIPDQILYLPYVTFRQHPSLFPHLTAWQIQHFTAADATVFTHLPREKWPHLSDRCLHTMPPNIIQSIQLTHETIPLIARLSREQMIHVAPEQVHRLPYQLFRQHPALAPRLSPAQVAQIQPSDISLLSNLTVDQWIHLSDAVFDTITREQIQRIPADIRYEPLWSRFSDTQLSHLTQEQITTIRSPALIQRLTALQIPLLQSGEQLNLISARQLKATTKEQKRKITNSNLLQNVTYIDLLKLHPAQMRHFTLVQKIAFAVSNIALTLFYTLTFIPIEISYLLTRICALRFIEPVHIKLWETFAQFKQMIVRDPLPT